MDVRETLTFARARNLALGGVATFFGLWCLLTYGGLVPAVILPSPTAVLRAFPVLHFQEALVGAPSGAFARVTMGFGFAAIVAIPLALLMGTFPPVKAFCAPILNAV